MKLCCIRVVTVPCSTMVTVVTDNNIKPNIFILATNEDLRYIICSENQFLWECLNITLWPVSFAQQRMSVQGGFLLVLIIARWLLEGDCWRVIIGALLKDEWWWVVAACWLSGKLAAGRGCVNNPVIPIILYLFKCTFISHVPQYFPRLTWG